MSKLAPIVLFVYNRPEHTRLTLESLSNNLLADQSKLYIYADGAKDNESDDNKEKIRMTRELLRERKWCKEVYIIESDKNNGLADSIVGGVTDVVNRYGKIIVLEDDIVTSPYFLKYMNDALDFYQNIERVMHVSSYLPYTTGAEKLPETYLLRFMSCWGWATWKRAWQKFIPDIDFLHSELPKRSDFEEYNMNGAFNLFSQIEANFHGQIKTWAIKWYSSIFVNDGLCLHPGHALSSNIGNDGSGMNSGSNSAKYEVELGNTINVTQIPVKENKLAKNYYRRFYMYGKDSSFRKRFRIFIGNTFIYRFYKRIFSNLA